MVYITLTDVTAFHFTAAVCNDYVCGIGGVEGLAYGIECGIFPAGVR